MMAEAVGWAQMQVAQAVVAVKRRPEAASEEPTPERSARNRVWKTVPVGNQQLSLMALFQLGSEAALIATAALVAVAASMGRRAGAEQQMALFDLPAPA